LVPKFIIEREIVGLGQLPPQELKAASQKSRSVLEGMGPQIQWLESYVTDNTMYCVYVSPDEDMVRTHAERGGFPADSVARIHSMIDPTTAE
jgi:Nickel responsive protein SCO4226-like